MKSRRLIRLAGLLWAAALVAPAETPRDLFNRGAERFTRSQDTEAKQIVDAGLQQYPDDAALLALKALLEQKQQQSSGSRQDQQDQPEQSQDSSDQKQDQNPDEPKPDQEPSGEDPAQGRSPEQSADEAQEEQPQEARQMTKEEAALLLDAMKQQEQAMRRKVALDRMRSNMDQLPPVDKDW